MNEIQGGKMSKYFQLKVFLENSGNTTEGLTFQKLEEILGFSLPHSAYIRREWWGNEIIQKTRHTHCKQWLNAGWEVESVNLGVNVTFSKIT